MREPKVFSNGSNELDQKVDQCKCPVRFFADKYTRQVDKGKGCHLLICQRMFTDTHGEGLLMYLLIHLLGITC